MKCKRTTLSEPTPYGVFSSFSRIAYLAVGWFGVYLTDIATIITLVGVSVATQINFALFVEDIPTNEMTMTQLLCVGALIVYPISCVKTLGTLSSMGFVALTFILLYTVALFLYGFKAYSSELFSHNDTRLELIPLWPQTFSSLVTYVATSTFCYGIVSIAFSVEETMKHPESYWKAVVSSLTIVCLIYAVIGDLAAVLYIHDDNGIQGNILLNMPKASQSAIIARISMAAVDPLLPYKSLTLIMLITV
jgi:hypothetical protein